MATERELERIIWRDCDKPDRIPAFLQLRDQFSPIRYWKVFRQIWEGSESLYLHTQHFPALFCQQAYPQRPQHKAVRQAFMSLGERQAVAGFTYPLTIYRGGWAQNIWGWSWTLDRDRAVWFANRGAMDGWPLLATARITRSDILGYLTTRNEQEIVVVPQVAKFRGGLVTRLPDRKMTTTDRLYQAIQSGTWADDPRNNPATIRFEAITQPGLIKFHRDRAARLRAAGLDWLAHQDDYWVRIAEGEMN